MKRMVFLFAAIVGITSVRAQNDGHTQQTTVSNPAGSVAAVPDPLELKETEHNFGMIAQNKPVYHYFEVVNNGLTPLKLDNVAASCGCTTPEWSKDAIPAGGSQKIRVGYNAAADGN